MHKEDDLIEYVRMYYILFYEKEINPKSKIIYI